MQSWFEMSGAGLGTDQVRVAVTMVIQQNTVSLGFLLNITHRDTDALVPEFPLSRTHTKASHAAALIPIVSSQVGAFFQSAATKVQVYKNYRTEITQLVAIPVTDITVTYGSF